MVALSVIPTYRSFELPWTQSAEQERRFRRLVAVVLAAVMALGVIVPLLPVAEPPENAQPPLDLIEITLEKPPPRPVPPPEVMPEPLPKPVPKKAVPPTPKPAPVVPPKPTPRPATPPKPTPTARERAASAGLAALSTELSALQDSPNVTSVMQASPTVTGTPTQGSRAERSLITKNAGAASGGISTAKISRGTGGSGLAGRNTTQVEGPAAVGGSAAGGRGGKARGGSGAGSRGREEIELVFDRNKGAIYALYNRALRENPALRGKVVLRLTIEPNGTVSACSIVSSELGDPALESRIVQRVKMFKFQAKDVAPMTTTKPLEFFPG
jgi:TonB family protein